MELVHSTRAACLMLCAGAIGWTQDPTFIRGDANVDGRMSMADAVMLRRHLFTGGTAPACLDAADSDDNGSLNISDYIRILLNFFPNNAVDWGKIITAGPYPEPGIDSTPDSLSCASYTVEPAEETQDVVRIGDVEAAPGEEVSVPVFLTNSIHVDAIQLVIRYDPALFTPESGGLREGSRSFDLEGTFYEILFDVIDGREANSFASLQAHPEDGLLTSGIVGSSLWEGWEVPPGNETILFRFRGVVSPEAQPGSTVLLEPTDGPDDMGVKPPLNMRNELTHRGEARFVVTLPTTKPGRIGIIDDVTFFVRGDANMDATVDIADPVFTLSHLFLGGRAPPCLDAADANDSGDLDLSDAVTTLSHLFDGGAVLPPPASAPGGDPTPDGLPRCRS